MLRTRCITEISQTWVIYETFLPKRILATVVFRAHFVIRENFVGFSDFVKLFRRAILVFFCRARSRTAHLYIYVYIYWNVSVRPWSCSNMVFYQGYTPVMHAFVCWNANNRFQMEYEVFVWIKVWNILAACVLRGQTPVTHFFQILLINWEQQSCLRTVSLSVTYTHASTHSVTHIYSHT